ncbi:MAG: nucleotidyl transferase AbiEii/AbiGii toxin family protein [Pseudomonadota bacterium]|nr:nucleotidyl transferase AbiEii/AbiGii toxin family protein [Pseudomonadota bacterium]
MFEREHHRSVALVLQSLDPEVLASRHCYFGGGTAMALRYGEYRESVDIDFLVSDLAGYRNLRQMLDSGQGLNPLVREGMQLELVRELRADQYGIRTQLRSGGATIKFEIVLEGRIELALPGDDDRVCGIASLSPLDLAAEKLLANADRWADDAVFSRDLVDLAMQQPSRALLKAACAKAEGAYGASIRRSLGQAVNALRDRAHRLDDCMRALGIVSVSKAQLWQRIRALQRTLPEEGRNEPVR